MLSFLCAPPLAAAMVAADAAAAMEGGDAAAPPPPPPRPTSNSTAATEGLRVDPTLLPLSRPHLRVFGDFELEAKNFRV